MTKSILFYDEHCGWSPSLNASKGTGGAEMHLTSLATWLAAQGNVVSALCHEGHGQHEAGVWYVESRADHVPVANRDVLMNYDVLITVRASRIPIGTRRIFSLQVDDPAPCPERFEHLKGKATLVCLSDWQAKRFRDLGHEDIVVIPSHIPDEYYDLASRYKMHRCYASFSAWNKGTDATLEAWREMNGRDIADLFVGCPYSAPPDAEARCERAGAFWLGELRPKEWLTRLSHAEAHVRICTIPETFGVTDAIARAMGVKLITLCEGDPGALEEATGSAPYRNRRDWEAAIIHGYDTNHIVRDLRASVILPKWLELIGG